MKKTISIILAIMMIASLAACGGTEKESTDTGTSASQTNHGTAAQSTAASQSHSSDSASSESTAEAPDPVTGTDITAEEATGAFSLTTEDGKFTQNGNVYTITAAGTYVLSGLLEGQIVVNAGEDDEVTLELSGVKIRR